MRHAVLAFALAFAAPAAAQDHARHGGAAAAAAAADAAADTKVRPDRAAAAREMAAINARMHRAMDVPMTGDIDVDFVRGMIPHHQGAIEMADLALKHSTDPFIRTLARAVAGAQRREIAAMRGWLKQKGLAEK